MSGYSFPAASNWAKRDGPNSKTLYYASFYTEIFNPLVV
jgi:hypothetical protein